ncbi:MAG: RNA polymerase sporulation sigma factor SigH [Armatimonadetes bacterium]|nr:RNA polymerase sporulation sigma factor SigH [Armatimonadota bacterium]
MVNAGEYFRQVAATKQGLHYEPMSDEELVRRVQQEGDVDACEYLLYKYRGLVRAKVNSYFLVGAERDDLMQIGMIGLWEAITDFSPQHHTSFASFAKVCIQRQMISAIKAATRQKQIPLNTSVSLDVSPHGDDDARTLEETLLVGGANDPEDVVCGAAGAKDINQALRDQLSPFEWEVLAEYRRGKSYREMAQELSCKVKSIDNALSRIRRKFPQVAPDFAHGGRDATQVV